MSSMFVSLISHHCHQLSHLLRFLGLRGLSSRNSDWLACGSDWHGTNLHVFHFSHECFGFQFVEFVEEIVLAFLGSSSEQVLPLLDLLHIFSHLILQIRDAVHVHLLVHCADGLVASPQTIHHVDICMRRLNRHFLLLKHDLLTVKLG